MLPFASEAKQVHYSALCGLQRHKAWTTGAFLAPHADHHRRKVWMVSGR